MAHRVGRGLLTPTPDIHGMETDSVIGMLCRGGGTPTYAGMQKMSMVYRRHTTKNIPNAAADTRMIDAPDVRL